MITLRPTLRSMRQAIAATLAGALLACQGPLPVAAPPAPAPAVKPAQPTFTLPAAPAREVRTTCRPHTAWDQCAPARREAETRGDILPA